MGKQHRNSQGILIPDGLWRVATEVQRLVSQPGVLPNWQAKVQEWLQRLKAASDDTRRSGEFVPLPLDLPLDEKYALLGAIYEDALGKQVGRPRIEGNDADEIELKNPEWVLLKVTIHDYGEKIDDDDVRRLLAWLDDVQADVRPIQLPPNPRPADPADMRPVTRDPAIEARDKWLYDQCCKLIVYQTIIRRLDKKPKTWLRIVTPQGIKKAASAYAQRQTPKLPPIPKRARGRIADK